MLFPLYIVLVNSLVNSKYDTGTYGRCFKGVLVWGCLSLTASFMETYISFLLLRASIAIGEVTERNFVYKHCSPLLDQESQKFNVFFFFSTKVFVCV